MRNGLLPHDPSGDRRRHVTVSITRCAAGRHRGCAGQRGCTNPDSFTCDERRDDDRRPSTTVRQPVSVLLLSWGAAAIGIFLIAIPSLYVDLPVSTKAVSHRIVRRVRRAPVRRSSLRFRATPQPRGRQVVAALIGVTAYKVLGAHEGVAGALGVATTIAVLQLAHSLHPPAGATALIAVLGPVQVHRLGYLFGLTPVLTGSVILLAVALIMNNLSEHANRHYPTFVGEAGEGPDVIRRAISPDATCFRSAEPFRAASRRAAA